MAHDTSLVVLNRGRFKNILKDANGNHFLWATRYISFINAYNDVTRPQHNPDKIKEIMLKNKELYKLLDYVPEDQINSIINEIASSFSLPIVRWLGYILIKILSKTLSSLYVNELSLLQIKNNMGNTPLILLPSHRSYADFILMAFVCFHYNIQLPYVAAGMDFKSMRVMGEILRNCKAFFMRRKFADDPVYRTIFEKYFQTIILLGESPLEFFIEGTRSRTAKTLTPKFGLLTTALDTYLKGDVPDITLLPVSITYDRLLEERLFTYELLGIPKPKESTLGMLYGFRNLDGSYGNVYFNFGEPISVRDWINQNAFKTKGNVDEVSFTKITSWLAHFITQSCDNHNKQLVTILVTVWDLWRRVSKLQRSFLHFIYYKNKVINLRSAGEKQTKLQILSVFNALAIVLSYRIWSRRSCSVPMEEAYTEIENICDLLKKRGALIKINGEFKEAVKSSCNVHSSLVDLTAKHITFKKSFGTVSADISLLKGIFNEQAVKQIVPVVMLQLYINPCLHLLIPPALVLFSLEPGRKLYAGSVPDAFKYLCEVFKLEFVTLTHTYQQQDAFNESVSFLRETGCITNNIEELGPNLKIRSLLYHLTYPFIAGYRIMAQTLGKIPTNEMKCCENTIVSYSQTAAKRLLDNGLIHPYCLSRDLLKNALDSFVSLNYVTKHNEGTRTYFLPEKQPLQRLILMLDTSCHFYGTNGLSKSRL